MNEDKKTIVAWMIPKTVKGYGNLDMQRRVYSLSGIAPAIRAYGGGNLEPKVIVRVRQNDSKAACR